MAGAFRELRNGKLKLRGNKGGNKGSAKGKAKGKVKSTKRRKK